MTFSQEQKAFHADSDAARFHNRKANPFIRVREQRLAQALLQSVGQCERLVEIGCGEGSNLDYYREVFPPAFLAGVDFSAEKVAFAAANTEAEYFCGDALALPLRDGSFDVAVCRDLLHHVDHNRLGVVREALRVVRPGGKVVFLESNGRTPLNLLFQYAYPVERGLRNSTPATLKALCSEHGQVELQFVECSLLVRAAGFVLGWPGLALRWLAYPLYGVCAGVEKLLETVMPRRKWAYMLVVLTRPEQ
ncbi:methyltransferase domain-containing protein [Pseudodesulfovibrio cashew]|uniref:Methyltransferase domain-containing protein n=1 Tax=Pseudodesulfovibrio cashew TaxID=2678688 RepID=A0A6I6JH11_9BACT|nr:class I SAM-dependent methyltransferase [Pseudodesulfovibrio cashew]QGY39357.1 methyltransferase domain-containing protein [Pseudodesulfovibrio cashew]